MKSVFAKIALAASLTMAAQQSHAFILITDLALGPAKVSYGLKAGAVLFFTAIHPILGLALFLGDDSEQSIAATEQALVAQGFNKHEAENVAIILANAATIDVAQGSASIALSELVEAAPEAAKAGLLSVLAVQK